MMNTAISFRKLVLHAALSIQPIPYRKDPAENPGYLYRFDVTTETAPAFTGRMLGSWRQVDGRLTRSWTPA